MGGFGTTGGRDEDDLSWTNELLPIEVRRALLDKALEELRLSKAAASTSQAVVKPRQGAGTPERPGKSGQGRQPPSTRDKPSA